MSDRGGHLIITADDWGYSARYDEGILEALDAGALDAVSAMVTRPGFDPEPLFQSGVEVGLHVEAPDSETASELRAAPARQAQEFEAAFGRVPAYIDGHRHCHATLPLAPAVEDLALELEVGVRPVGADHRMRLIERGVRCVDRIVGRMEEREPAPPPEISEAVETGELPAGTTEWVVHPGHSDPASGSSYDRGREQDLAVILSLADEAALTRARTTHAEALRAPVR